MIVIIIIIVITAIIVIIAIAHHCPSVSGLHVKQPLPGWKWSILEPHMDLMNKP